MSPLVSAAALVLVTIGVLAVVILAYHAGRCAAALAIVARGVADLSTRVAAHEHDDAERFAAHGAQLARVEERLGIVKQTVVDELDEHRRTGA